MPRKTMLIIFLLLLLCSILSACAGGSRGTGVRYNRSTEQIDFDDEEDDEEFEERTNRWHWR